VRDLRKSCSIQPVGVEPTDFLVVSMAGVQFTGSVDAIAQSEQAFTRMRRLIMCVFRPAGR
jgi:hypothetical protein